MKAKLCILMILAEIILLRQTVAQDLEVISLKKGVKVNGSLNVNTVGYKAFGLQNRRDPFNWFLTGGLNITLFGYSAPFSFSYSNANSSYTQPFNRFHFAPSYKWIRTYTGNTSMSFSPYTLSGHLFFGGGVELTPGKWQIATMYGRLRKAVPYNFADTSQWVNASYKRMGCGIKVAYADNGNSIGLSLFAAKDDLTSLPYTLGDNPVTPQQNVAVGLSGKKKLFKKFFIDLEYALSALNTNTLANEKFAEGTYQTKNLLRGLLPENSTSRYFDAINSSVGYQGNAYTIQLKYERIAPEYKTLGAYYFNNDMRNITVVTNVKLLKNKITLSTNVGRQQNNLDQSRASSTSRTVASANVQFSPNEKWNISGNYSNFLSYTNVKARTDPFYQNSLDTLNFYQVSETMGGTLTRSLGNKENPQSIMINGSYQKANNKAAYQAGQLSNFMNGSFSYSYGIPSLDLTVSTAANVSSNNAAGMQSSFFGPSVNTSKSFLEKLLRASYSTSYSKTITNGIGTSPIWNNQMSFSFAPAPREKKDKEDKSKSFSPKANFSLALNVLTRLKGVGEQPAFTEFTANFNCSYSF